MDPPHATVQNGIHIYTDSIITLFIASLNSRELKTSMEIGRHQAKILLEVCLY